jgi:hypothetical protein
MDAAQFNKIRAYIANAYGVTGKFADAPGDEPDSYE